MKSSSACLPCLSSAFSPCFGETLEPFDEMKLTSTQLDKKIEKLNEKGYFTIRMTQTTRAYMKKRNNPEENWQQTRGMKTLALNADYEQTAADMATAVVSRITQRQAKLKRLEFQIRRPLEAGTTEWHEDRKPKLLACVATLEGKGTEYVSPSVAKEKFTRSTNILSPGLKVTNGEASLGNAIKEAKKDRFYFFAACGMSSEHIPKLVHRAPPSTPEEQSNRSIFIARWSPDHLSDPLF